MTVLLDTARLPPSDREDALQAAFTEFPQRVAFLGDARVQHRSEVVDLGPGLHLRRDVGCPLLVRRDARHVRISAPEVIAIAFTRQGEGVLSTAGQESVVRPGSLGCLDTTLPYQLAQRTLSSKDVLLIDQERLGVSLDDVRAAQPLLARSPVHDLVRAHLAGLFDATASLAAQRRFVTGQATAALVRTLLLTAAENENEQADALNDTLELRIDAHIEAHLSDRDLGVEQIAAAHSISVRQLYKVWARSGRDQTLAQWIITRRLQRARDLLVAPEAADRGIATLARQCGFSNTSHFSRRFREVFGTTPREWRAAHHPAPLSDR